MGKVIAICKSEKRGTVKTQVPQVMLLQDHGLEGDAHAGNWHRQVSLLSLERIEEFREKGVQVGFGDFGENLVLQGYDLRSLPVGSRLRVGKALLEVTQIGKECHTHCQIYQQTGDCIMPREGIFARVLESGLVSAGDMAVLEPMDPDRPFTAAWITLSDKGAAGSRTDESGPLLGKMLTDAGYEIVEHLLLPDGIEPLKSQLIRLADQRQINVIFTTGGTGFSPRDLTPEATEAACERKAPGIAEALRAYSLTKTPHAMLSRGVSGIRGRTLIINLPGSPKAVRESLEYLLPSLGHGLGVLRGTDGECGRA